jgi:hypothetical protein
MMAGIMHVDDAIDVTNGFQAAIPFHFNCSETQATENRFHFEVRQRQRP